MTEPVQDGFSVTVRRKADPALTKDACVIEVHDRQGRLVFSREGFNTKLHDDGRRDVDNDGSPDLVIGFDSRATNRCCREYAVLSLTPAPRAVGTFANLSFETDRGRTTVWATLSFDDFATDVGPVPTIVIVGQFREGRFVDLTTERCPVILAGTSRGSREPVPGSLADRSQSPGGVAGGDRSAVARSRDHSRLGDERGPADAVLRQGGRCPRRHPAGMA